MKKKNKWLYTFTIDREIENKVTEKKKDESGEEVEVTKTIKETVPIKLSIRKPNRKLYDQAELFYGVKMSEGIKAGLLTRNLLSKRYEDDGGAFSEVEKQRYSELYMAIYNKESEYQRLQVNLDKKPQELKDRISEDILSEIAELRRELIEIENSQSNIFDQTAENRAKNQTIMWWVLELSHWKEHGREEYIHFFDGADYQEKLDSYDEYEESEDDFLNEAIKKLAFFISFWYMGRATSEDEFKAVEDLYNSQEEETEEATGEATEEATEEVTEEAPKKKATKKKRKPKVTKETSKSDTKTEEKAKEEPVVSEAVAEEEPKVSGEVNASLKSEDNEN